MSEIRDWRIDLDEFIEDQKTRNYRRPQKGFWEDEDCISEEYAQYFVEQSITITRWDNIDFAVAKKIFPKERLQHLLTVACGGQNRTYNFQEDTPILKGIDYRWVIALLQAIYDDDGSHFYGYMEVMFDMLEYNTCESMWGDPADVMWRSFFRYALSLVARSNGEVKEVDIDAYAHLLESECITITRWDKLKFQAAKEMFPREAVFKKVDASRDLWEIYHEQFSPEDTRFQTELSEYLKRLWKCFRDGREDIQSTTENIIKVINDFYELKSYKKRDTHLLTGPKNNGYVPETINEDAC